MDFLSLSSEYESYQEYYTKTKDTMFTISNFFINYHKSLNEYATSIDNSLNELLSNLISYDKNIIYIQKLFSFFQLFEKHLLNLTSISKKVLTEIISPTADFTSFLFGENKKNLEKLKKIIESTNIQKNKYDKQKEIYFESCKLAERQEKKLIEEMNKNHNNNDAHIKNKNDLLTKLRVTSQEEYEKYKNEHAITNKLYNDNNTKYFKIVNSLKDNEEKRIHFLSFHVDKFLAILNEEKNSINNVIEINSNLEKNNVEENSLKFQLDEDMKIYKDKFNFVYKPNQRFLEEELLMYDIYRRKIESIMKKNNLLFKQITNRKDLLISYMPSNITSNLINTNLNLTTDMEIYFSKFNNINLEQNDLIVYKNIFDKNPMNVNIKLFDNFKTKLKNDSKFAQKIIDKTHSDYFRNPVIFYEFQNLEQFNRLGQILINVCNNKDIYNKILEVNFGVINIAEKGFILDPDTKKRKYLCQILAQNCELFQNKTHWKNLFLHKIDEVLNNLIKKEIGDEPKLTKKDKKNKEKEEEYKKMRQKKLEEIKQKNCFNIIKEFIVHFPNFNVDVSISNDLIMNVGNMYGLTKEEIKYLVCYMNSNIYSIKSSFQKINNNNISKNSNNNLSINYNIHYLLKNINNTNNMRIKKLYLILNSVFNYLNPKDYLNIRCVNKFFYENSEKKIYKFIFLKSDKSPLSINLFSIKKHTGMWYHFLKYKKSSLNYSQISSKILSSKSELKFQETIQMDILRTYFEENQELMREKAKNILTCLSEVYPKIGYCQGMHHICQFLLEITSKNETETFNLFSAIISKTNYEQIVINDFKLMKKYFYVFDRLISIYLPDLFVINKSNNIGACFYISPWFITLFTMRFQKKQTKLLLRVFDMFILDGWICIVRIGLVMLKYYQKDLVKMKYEELLQFLINELKDKYDFFGNYNYDKFMEMYKEMKIPKGLINNIENEYALMQAMENSKNI